MRAPLNEYGVLTNLKKKFHTQVYEQQDICDALANFQMEHL